MSGGVEGIEEKKIEHLGQKVSKNWKKDSLARTWEAR